MKNFPHVFADVEFQPRRPNVCFLFGDSKSTSNVSSVNNTTTTNLAEDNRIAATDNAVIVGANGTFQVVTNTDSRTIDNSINDSRNLSDNRSFDNSVQVGDGMYVGPGGTLNLLDGGAIKLAGDAAKIAADASAAAADAAAKAAKDTTDALVRGHGQTLDAIAESNSAAFGFGRSIVDESFGFGERIAQANESLAERAINAVMNTAKDAASQSGSVVNAALDSLLESDKSSEERAFSNITTMVKWIVVAAAVVGVAYAMSKKG